MPSTSELIDWLYVLQEGGVGLDGSRSVPFLGVLIKNESDLAQLKRRNWS